MKLKTETTYPLNILLVEDDDIDAMSLERAFHKMNLPHQITRRKNGLEASKYLTREAQVIPDLILLDINMPGMNGLEFLSWLRSNPTFSHVSVYILTTSEESTDKKLAWQMNVSGYLVKPMHPNEFNRLVSTMHNFWQISTFPA